MMREVSRTAHRVLVTATSLEPSARAVLRARTDMHVLAGQGGLPPGVKEEAEKTLQDRLEALKGYSGEGSFVLTDDSDVRAPLLRLSDAELSQRLWRLDRAMERLDAMRETIAGELERYERESATLRQQRTALKAAQITGDLSRPTIR